ncbi:putative bifunctional diguanylate cyclase/phosphodiesterase [Craterilacuibacter sp.]|uniref:putative bifunctional diguanylate cyclase/phosphodiesterase n=1 Tax=Craterilacuibacter sp. TaxID=2870909 RepID=UPI003F338532
MPIRNLPDATPAVHLQSMLTRRFALLMSALAAVLLAGSLILLNFLSNASNDALMQTEANKASLLLTAERERLQSLVHDYASWDDSYNYVQQPVAGFIENSFAASYRELSIDFTAILRHNGELLYLTSGDGSRPPPLSLREMLSDPAILGSALKPGQVTSRLVLVADRPLQLVIAAISSSDETAPSNGVMVMGRYLDGTRMARLGAVSGLTLALVRGHSAAYSEYRWPATVHYRMLQPLTDAPGWSLRIDKQIDRQMLLFAWLLFFCCMLLLLGVAFWWVGHFLRKRVIHRLELFARLARSGTGAEAQHWPVEGHCELAELARAYNQQMDEAARARQHLYQQAITDALTGLGNRRALENTLAARLEDSSNLEPFSLLLMDVDGFKLINDSLGYLSGDCLLQALALRLSQAMQRQDQLFRIGGDEFCILLPGEDHALSARLNRDLLPALRQPFEIDGHVLKMTASAGLAGCYPGMDAQRLMRHADLAMYAAKQQGRNCLCIYQHEMGAAADARLQLEQALRLAIAAGDIQAWFQPVVNGRSGQVVSLEVLARWSWQGKMVPPLTFISLAEELGLIAVLWETMLHQALANFSRFLILQPALKLQLNLSVLQLVDTQLVGKLQASIAHYGLPQGAVSVEITESMTLDGLPQARAMLSEMVAAGIGLHLDDFGTGYSSMARLHELPFDTVKLDRSFVALLGEGDDTLARTVYEMAQGMGLALIAEGVETALEYQGLRAIGYEQMQGYLFARPMCAEAMLAWLAEPHDWPVLPQLAPLAT